MKSPTSSVGRIDELGILNGSATKERRRNTISSTGKKLFGYSIHHGSGAPGARRLTKYQRSARAMTPVTTVSTNRMSAKFMGSFVADLEDGEEGFLRNLHAADGFHAFLAGFLFLQQFALARDVAAVALRQHVLAQRLDRLAGDDLGADRRLDRDIEHLPRNQRAHFGDHLAPAILRRCAVDHDRQSVDALAVDENVQL